METAKQRMALSIWSHRPQLLHWTLFTAAYVPGCGFAKALAIVPGSTVSFWPPGGLLMATLMLTPTRSWPWWILAGALAESFGQLVWFSSGLPIGFLIIAGNVLEAMAGAWLVNRVCGRPVRLETLREVLAFVVLGAGLAPVISATVGSATLWWFGIKSQPFWASWPLWWIGDATGILIVAPLTLVAIQNWRSMAKLRSVRWIELSIVGLIFLGVAALSLGGYLPFAYIVMPPLLWVAVRFDFKGAAITLILLALVTAVFTLSGASQFAGNAESQRQKQIMLHLFLAVSALSALIVAAISRQHQQALATLRESERQLQQMIDAVPVRIWSTRPAGGPVYFNKRYQDYFRAVIPNFDALGEPRIETLVQQLIHPDDAPGVQRTLQQCFESGNGSVLRFRWREKDGVYRWAECRVEPRRDQDGTVAEWYGVSIDIDDQMRLYSDIAEREAKIRRLVDSDIIGIVIWNLDGRLIDANDAFLRMVQYEREDLKAGLCWFDMTPPEWQEVHARDEAEEIKATGMMQAREKEFFRKDGSRVPVLIGAACFEGQSREGVAYILDLTERKRAEAALRDRERELAQLVDMLPVYIRRLTPEGEPIFFNKRLTDFIGVGLAEIGAAGTSRLRPSIENFVHPDEAAKVVAALRRAVATGEDYAMRYRMRGADGVYRWIETRAEPLRNQDGKIAQWYSVSIDIDEEVRAQQALRERERELSQLVETLPAMIYCAAPNGEPTYRSRQLREYLGFDVQEKEGPGGSRLTGTLDAVIHPDELAAVKERYGHSIGTGEPYALKHRLRRVDGEYRWVETRAAAMRNAEGAIVQWNGICLDIEDQVRAQEKLRLAQENFVRASQAASLAELSASIAHEVNQPLAAVVANSHACQRWLAAENIERAQKTVERIIRDANAAADVVGRIRALFSRSATMRNSAPLGSVIAEARNLMADEAARRRVRLDVDIESSLPPVAFDRVQVQQVLINLIRNGMDSMDTILGDRVLGMRARRAGDAIQIEIFDRGRGVEFPDKVFEPFFTTKEHGMGMGLAICRSIVESHGGRLWAEKNEPQGATFIFTLPVETKTAS